MNNVPIFKFAIREDLQDCYETFLPKQAESLSTGYDVRAAFKDRKTRIVYPFDYILIPLGFRAFCPNGWWYELKPRSSTFVKKQFHCLYGTIDQTYENELILAAQYIPESLGQTSRFGSKLDFFGKIEINFGDAIGQIIPVKRQEMIIESISNDEYDNLCKNRNATRGTGGFGSTDEK